MEDFSSDEMKMIVTALKEMDVKPDLDSPTAFKDWMVKYVKGLDVKPQTPGQNASASGNSTTTTTHESFKSAYIPKISIFSSDGSKQDSSYDQWRYEVECRRKEKYSDSVISQAIRRSLRGDAGRVVMRLGPEATIAEMLDKMESVFGTVERGESIMQDFYSATQRKGEDTMTWSCRLEEIYRKAVEKGVVKKEDANEKLKSRFWNGLHQWLRDITGYKYDSIADFDQLRKEIRLIEKEHDKKTTQSMALTSEKESGKSELDEIKGMIQQLTTKVNRLETGHQQRDFGQQEQPSSTRQQQEKQHNRGGYNNRGGRRGGFNNRQGGSYGGRGYSSDNYDTYPHHDRFYYEEPQQHYGQQPRQQDYYEEPTCYRCGQPGYLQRGCRVILDHSKRGLNSNRPSSRGRW